MKFSLAVGVRECRLKLSLTESGRLSLLTKLADTPELNASVWRGLPGFQWYAPVTRAKSGTQTLAVHADRSQRRRADSAAGHQDVWCGKEFCSWEPMEPGVGVKVSKTNTIIAFGGKSLAGWRTNETWLAATTCVCSIRPIAQKSARRFRLVPM